MQGTSIRKRKGRIPTPWPNGWVGMGWDVLSLCGGQRTEPEQTNGLVYQPFPVFLDSGFIIFRLKIEFQVLLFFICLI